MTVRKYGWRPDKPDFRDHICDLPWKGKETLLKSVDLRNTGHLPPIYDQGQTGSCTGNGVAACVEYGLKAQGKHDYIPSRLFIYYNERLIEGTVNEDAGAEIRDGIKVVVTTGVCDENLWPFDPNKLTIKPSDIAYTAAKKGVIKKYSRVPVALHNIQNVLAHNIPVVFGVTLYDSFESQEVAQTGIVPMPSPNENVVGGHCMVIVGYDDNNFIVRNSWGEGWGDKGYCYIPIPYLTNASLADDFWAIFIA